MRLESPVSRAGDDDSWQTMNCAAAATTLRRRKRAIAGTFVAAATLLADKTYLHRDPSQPRPPFPAATHELAVPRRHSDLAVPRLHFSQLFVVGCPLRATLSSLRRREEWDERK
jgi:hypothetical protein